MKFVAEADDGHFAVEVGLSHGVVGRPIQAVESKRRPLVGNRGQVDHPTGVGLQHQVWEGRSSRGGGGGPRT